MTDSSLRHEAEQLQSLVNINKDAHSFYQLGVEKAKSSHMRTTFNDLAALHDDVVVRLQQMVHARGGKYESEETLGGQFQQFWANIGVAITDNVDMTLVNHLEQAEDRCLHAMRDVIDDDNLAATTRSELQAILLMLQRSHDLVRSLKHNLEQTAA